MRIGIDIRGILSPHHEGNVGAGHYIFHLVNALLDLDARDTFVLLHDQRLRQKDRLRLETHNSVEWLLFPQVPFSAFMPGLYNELFGGAFLSRAKLDVLHLPLSSVRVPTSYRGRIVVSVYDLGVYLTPDHYSPVFRARQKAIKMFNARKADAVIVPHEALGVSTAEIFQYPRENMYLVQPGVDKRFSRLAVSGVDSTISAPSRKIARQYGVRGKYIITVGTVEPVKNLQRLMHAFAIFRDRRRAVSDDETSDYKLLIVGRSGSGSENIKNFIRDLDLENDVKFSGYVHGDDMAQLIAGASMSVHPALYEGLGLSALESLVAGVPSVFSDIPVHKEIAGVGALYFDPYDTQDIARAMGDLINIDSDISVQDSDAVSDKYNWQSAAEKTMDIYKKIVQ
jgi:glycosyltransferase involved in cell wall biosynthesis